MTTTAELLEAMTDRGQFELLATAVLRRVNLDYKAIIHLGINAKGETITAPVDGFCHVPGSNPPRYLLVAHTTTDRERLDQKWLFDHTKSKGTKAKASDDGDLVKAGREAALIRLHAPHATFTVLLATNQHLQRDLVNDVDALAAQLKLGYEIWEQSRLTDYLDNDAEGQWLRRRFLCVEAERLSASLLEELCTRSLAAYERQFLDTEPALWVPRAFAQGLVPAPGQAVSAVLVIGDSGCGKSVSAYQALREHLASGGHGLWMPTETVAGCQSIEEAIDRTLRVQHPNLVPGAGRTALQLRDPGAPFLLVVENLHESVSPASLARRILSWCKPARTAATGTVQAHAPACLIVCPMQPDLAGPLARDLGGESWIRIVRVGHLSPDEGAAAIQAAARTTRPLTHPEAQALAERLGEDPLLIGLFRPLTVGVAPEALSARTENVLRRFIERNIDEARSPAGGPGPPAGATTYREALVWLAARMLRTQHFRPTWAEVRRWFNCRPEQARALQRLLAGGGLCRLATEDDVFTFRHDRIRDAFLVEAMGGLLRHPVECWLLLREPYYAELVGRALTHHAAPKGLLTLMRRLQPLALFETVRSFGGKAGEYQSWVVAQATAWVREVGEATPPGYGHGVFLGILSAIGAVARWVPGLRRLVERPESPLVPRSIPPSMLHAVTWSLVQTDSPAVLGITDGSPAIPLLLIARLRNGCARSGVLYCASSPLFLPAVNDAVWDDAVEQALQHHRTPLLVEMKRILTAAALPDRDRKGALMLAGFLALPELGGDVARCWQRAGDREAVLFEALWAALRCAGPEQLESLRPHLGRLDENDLAFLAQACERIGAIEWSHEHLMEHLSAARRRQYYPSDNQLREDLSRFAEDEGFGPGHIWAWLEGFERRRDPENRALRVVDAWLANHRTLRGLAVAATCVSAVGRRPDLAILNRYPIDGPLPEIVNLKRDAAFAVRRRSLE